ARAPASCDAGGVQRTTASQSPPSSNRSIESYCDAPDGSPIPAATPGTRSATAARTASGWSTSASAYALPTRPAPTSPILRRSAMSVELPRRLGHGAFDQVDVLVLVPLVPGEHEHSREEFVRAGEPVAPVVECLGIGQRERPSAGAERALL